MWWYSTTFHASLLYTLPDVSLGIANHSLTGTDIAKPASFFSTTPKEELQPWGPVDSRGACFVIG